MSFSKPIHWRQGIFLQPQHFQYSDARAAESLGRVLQFSHLGAGGVAALTFAAERLRAGFLACSALEAFMPGGCWVHLGDNARLPERDLRCDVLADGSYRVAVDQFNLVPGVAAVGRPDSEARFVAGRFGEALPDLYDDSPPVDIERLHYSLRFLIGEEIENAQNTTCLVIGKLIVEAGNLKLDETFFPPCAHIGAFVPLSRKIESLIETLQIKVAQLTNTAAPWRFETDSLDSGWLRDRLIHSELAQALIETEHRVRVQAPPAHVFEAFASLIGRLSALAGFKNVEIPIWDAGDQSRSFFTTGALLDALFDQLRSGPDATAVFKLRDGWFEARVPASAHIGEFSAFLVLEQANESQMFSSTMAKLASLQRIETVVSRALPGIPIELIERPPYGLRSGTDTIVWRIDVNDPLWREAQSSGAVCLHWHGLAKTARMHLVYYRG